KERLLPYGLDVIALRVAALERAEAATRDAPYHREHGTTYIYQNPSLFRIEPIETPAALALPRLDLTINHAADYDFVAQVYEGLYPAAPAFSVHDLFAYLRRTPELLAHPNAAALRSAP